MAKGNLTMAVQMAEYFTQTRLKTCFTVNCANRKLREFECNLKEIDIRDGSCLSLVEQERDDVVIIPRKD